MFKRMSDALKTASNDRTYILLMIALFLVLVSSILIKSPIVWFVALGLIAIMNGMLIRFYLRNGAKHEKK